jgi:hypothetical protein
MKKTIALIALAFALQTLTITLLAQNGPGGRAPRGGGGPGGHRPPPSPIVMALDANGDGVIDAQEIANAPAALASLDTNGDGKLSPDELRPQPPQNGQGNKGGQGARKGRAGQQQSGGPGQGPGEGHPLPPLVAALDANGDGTIDAQEIANSSAALKALDANGDGQLTHDEFCPPPPGGGPGEQQWFYTHTLTRPPSQRCGGGFLFLECARLGRSNVSTLAT